jgi:hypothetical protein
MEYIYPALQVGAIVSPENSFLFQSMKFQRQGKLGSDRPSRYFSFPGVASLSQDP